MSTVSKFNRREQMRSVNVKYELIIFIGLLGEQNCNNVFTITKLLFKPFLKKLLSDLQHFLVDLYLRSYGW